MGEVYDRVEKAVREALDDLSGGDRLPSERVIARTLNAGRTTVRLVLLRLAAEGLIHAVHGRGYFKT